MTTRLDALLSPRVRQRYQSNLDQSWAQISAEWVKFGGLWYQGGWGQTQSGVHEDPPQTLEQFIHSIHRRVPVIAAANSARANMMSDIHFRWQDEVTGELDPKPIEELEGISRALHKGEMHVGYGGNMFLRWTGERFVVLRPDWIRIVATSTESPTNALQASDVDILGYWYEAPTESSEGVWLEPDEVVHHAPEPDPLGTFRGESWVNSVVTSALLDLLTEKYALKFFENAATPNLVFSMDKEVEHERIKKFTEFFREKYEGVDQSHRSMIIGGGANVQVVGSKISDLELRELQGGFESRTAVRSRVPSSVLGTREGNQGSALNATAYGQMRRLWAEGWFVPTVRQLCAAFERVITPPPGKRLAWDPHLTLMLQEDAKERAEIISVRGAAVNALITAGFETDAAIKAVRTDSLHHLEGAHTGLVSVQLLPPGETGQGDPAKLTDGPQKPPARETVEIFATRDQIIDLAAAGWHLQRRTDGGDGLIAIPPPPEPPELLPGT